MVPLSPEFTGLEDGVGVELFLVSAEFAAPAELLHEQRNNTHAEKIIAIDNLKCFIKNNFRK